MEKQKLRFKKVLSLLLIVCCIFTSNFSSVFAKEKAAENVRIPFNDARVTYSNGWNNYQNIQMYCNEVGCTATVEFEGTGFVIWGGAAKNGPIATVDIDGVVEDADFFRADGTGAETKIYEKKGLEDKEHTAVITFTDRTNPDVSNSFADFQIAIYAFEELHYSNTYRNVNVTGGKVSAERVLVGDEVEITADQPNEGEVFVRWETSDVELEDENAATTKFLMPDKDVTVKAVFEKKRTESRAFYIDGERGDDNADGKTPATAWRSLSKVDGKQFLPGDKILFKAGTEYNGKFYPKGSGTAENPISIDIYDGDTIGAEAGERAAIHAQGKSTSAIWLQNVSHWNISNMEVTNQGPDHSKRLVGVNVEVTELGVYKGFHLDNLFVHDVTGTLDGKDKNNGGIYFTVDADKNAMTGNECRFADILIENCYVKDVSRTGISMGCTAKDADSYGYGGILPEDFLSNYYHTNVVLRNNYVERAGGDAIVPMYCMKPLIEYNVADNCSQNTKDNPNAMYNAGIWPWRCEDAVFQFNEAFGTQLNGDGQAFDCDFSRGTIYQYNYSHDNKGGFMLVCQGESLESVIRYNISQNDKRTLFMLSNPNEAVFYNNTFYIDGADIDSRHGGKASMYNNIFYNVGSKKDVHWGNNSTYENNLYYGFNNVPNDSNKVVADPMFVNPGKGGTAVLGDMAIDTLDGYQLQKDSPAIDAGKEIADNGGRDYFGTELKDGKTDIGAAEYVAEVVDKTDLEALIGYAQEQKTNPAYQYLVPAVKTLFEKALADAETVWEKPNATRTEVDAAYDTLLAKVHLLDFTGNAESLKVLVDAAEAKYQQEEMYTKESWEPFAKAFEAARELLKDENALQEEIDAAKDALQAAMDALVLKPINTKKLEKLVADSKQYEDNIDNYTSDSAQTFTAALEGARGVLAGDKLTQEAVDSAYTTLRSAIFGLREVPNKDKLGELLGKVKAMDLSVYSKETANAVKAAYAKATAVFEDENADQKKVDAAVAALEEAVAAANEEAGMGDVSKEDGTSKKEDGFGKDNKVASDNAGSKGTTNKTAGKSAAKTGDGANATIPAVAGLMAILAAVVAWRKRINA